MNNTTVVPTPTVVSHTKEHPFLPRCQHIIVNPVDLNNIFGHWQHSQGSLTLLLFFQSSQPGQRVHIDQIGNLYHMTAAEVESGIGELTTAGYIALGGAE